ncbi:14-3-3-like protein GF14 lambda [Actinidia chinensis var. chinensis]|uniref:14-3-3-like protein GF14 lambda n=1 Tax=Actinidia chinensis var. chinensis TaxID=1590841 RepID=A0A2R6PNB5_ACTCC|nr:14-3-3-like protein GF14 lambda [Actinidia chinensis var. chinensis]
MRMRYEYTFMAKLAEQAHRYEDMVEWMDELDPVHVALVNEYKSKVESELSQVCNRILSLLDLHLIPSASTHESKVFYLKTKGDYHRYLAEFKVGLEREIAAEDAMLSYKAAEKIARADLSPTNHVRLGLELNYSVFFYEIEHDFEKASSMAREALEDAVEKRDVLGHMFHKESILILQLLRDNFALWTSNMEVSDSYYN